MFALFLSKSTRNLRSGRWKVILDSILPNYSRYVSSTVPQQWPTSTSASKSQTKLKISYPPSQTGLNSSITQNQSSQPFEISESVTELLPLLAVQPSHYIIIHIHGKPYLVTTGDLVRLPFKMSSVVPGDILRLNRATCIGSRDYSLKGTPYVDERIYECRATVIGTESEPMRFKEKTKRRCRKVKTVKSKHHFTIIRIADLKIKNLADMKL
ncbi:54S ribosomal protein L49, mitochondrial [Erysiphe necator]|nr:54S ribosomal protein L49, mitochondrial [Erysiphe necator]